ncbi:hypothetical protein Q5530_12625 [Saccharothrix sp. BKS2]|uniref:hypothetical protein n=1 Tax=Saccharothrix sp. BKS2 TaxID=3064400 RepID=UPI0039E90C9A
MRAELAITAATLALATVAVVPGTARAAQPAQDTATSAVSPAPDGSHDVRAEAINYTFSHATSVALYNAAKTGGAGAVAVICARLGGPIPGLVCGVLAEYLIDQATNPPAPGRCYQVYPVVGLPPVAIREVNC